MKYLIPLLLLTSCSTMDMAAMQQQYKQEVCNREKGFEMGRNDAEEGKRMDSSFAGVCDPQDRRDAMAGYREGFESISNQQGGDGVVVKVPGIDIRVGNGQQQKSWACEISVFGDTFSGFADSRGRASAEAREKCSAKHNSIHCQHVECRVDR